MFRANVRTLDSKFHKFDDGAIAGTFSYVPVQCFPLNSYFYALNVTHVDLLSLDTQGSKEFMILNFDFKKIRVNYLFVEHLQFGDGITDNYLFDKLFVDEVNAKGFKLLFFYPDFADYIFMNELLFNSHSKDYGA